MRDARGSVANKWDIDGIGPGQCWTAKGSQASRLVSPLNPTPLKSNQTHTAASGGGICIEAVSAAPTTSFGHKTLVGTGASPPVDEAAIANMLSQTPGPSVVPDFEGLAMAPSSGEGSDAATAIISA
ncbi:hypothetical protein B0H16DRAFT_1725654 [Mycena metata]|uniref:Uncharacterized protein n=1 Tax=Mycena metata TaxID=1033252 RepID=A0AAD7N6Z5_9AGAR|nr:hypothetical protein B0H16DRAFT_1725654 [Mycena metata]